LGGWNISEITTFQSGQTLSLSASGNVTTAQRNITSNRPNVVPGVSDQLAYPTIAQWFNTAAFTPPAPFTFGNASTTIPNVMGPRLLNTDFALYKDFRIREKYIIDLREKRSICGIARILEIPISLWDLRPSERSPRCWSIRCPGTSSSP
jgi:hypothetical protein